MCTITYLPLGSSSYILTSNRDEGAYRKIALPPEKYTVHNMAVYFPKDMEANGTWFAAAETKFTLCLMNGAFERHKHNPPYRLSRGIMLLDFFIYRDVDAFISQYDFNGIEPFTLFIIEQSPDVKIHEICWDGKKVHYITNDASVPHIWSSAQLYEKEVIRGREVWFDAWLKAKNEFTMEKIILFHKTGGDGNSYTDLLMNRDGKVFTVSITSVKREENKGLMHYEDMISKNGVKEIRIG